MVAEMRASVAYDTTTLVVGDDEKCHEYLGELADRVEGQGDTCVDVPAEAFDERERQGER